MFQIVHLQQEIHLMEASTAYNKNNWLVEAEALRMRFCSYYYEYEVTRGNFLKWNTSKNTNQNNNSIINDDLKRRNTSSTPNSGSSSYSKPKPVSTAITFQDVIKVPEPPPGNFPSPPSAGLKRASSVGHRFKPKASLEILTADQSQIMQKTNSNNSINIPSNITSRSGGSTESIPRDIQHSGGSNDSIHKTAAGAATGVAGGGRTSVNSARGGGEKEKTLRIKSARESYQRSGASSDMDLHRRVSEDNIPENSVSESSPKSAVSAASFTWAFPRKNGGGGSGTIRSKTRIDTLLLPAQHIQNKLGSAESAPSLTSATGNKGSAESNKNDIASILELSDNIIVESPTTAATANDVSDQQGVNVGTPRRISGRLYSISRDFKSRSQKSVEDVNAKISKLFM